MPRLTKSVRDKAAELTSLYLLAGHEPISELMTAHQMAYFKHVRIDRWERHRGKFKRGEYSRFGPYYENARVYFEIQLVAEILLAQPGLLGP